MATKSHRARDRWNIFCRVVDNFGDIGVCWRLARTLAVHHGKTVRLWLDDVGALRKICPQRFLQCGNPVFDGVEIHRWEAPFELVADDDVVIEAFGCELPEACLATMASAALPPLWINLEYLSAEDWVSGCHRMRSPHPRLPLVKHFFFPGFTADTGGLLREPRLFADRDVFQANPSLRARVLADLAGRDLPQDATTISLFSYEQAQLHGLMRAWAADRRPVVVLVPEGRVVPGLARYFGTETLQCGDWRECGSLAVRVIPFTDQTAYDRLLWACDLNFVRGEDSFVRAQWAARPFIWQLYAQADNAQAAKLEAFLKLFTDGLSPPAAAALVAFWRAWNGYADPAACWRDFSSVLPEIAFHAGHWSQALGQQQDLASALVDFSEKSV